MRVEYGPNVVLQTLSVLQEGGRDGCECVVLWLGRMEDKRIRVSEVYRPIHEAQADMFWITEQGMDVLKARLRSTGTMVAAQVHTHPERAYHSRADDRFGKSFGTRALCRWCCPISRCSRRRKLSGAT